MEQLFLSKQTLQELTDTELQLLKMIFFSYLVIYLIEYLSGMFGTKIGSYYNTSIKLEQCLI